MNSFQIANFQVDQTPIGSGCSGEVFRAKGAQDNNPCVAKRYNSMCMDRLLMESIYGRYQSAPDHEGIVPLKAFQFNQTPYFSVTEFDSGQKLINSGPFKEANAWYLIHRLADAMGHSHRYGMVHGNLHPGNIFYSVNKDDEIRLRIGDFGSGMIGEVHHVDLDETAYFAAPEQLLCLGANYGNGNAERWDVYRFGAIAFWLLNQTFPRGKGYLKSRAQDIANSGGRPVPVDPIALATVAEREGRLPWRRRIGSGRKEKRYKDIIERCLSLDPEKRPVDMRDVHQEFLNLEKEFTLIESEEHAAAELAEAEGRVTKERRKQKTKLFTARALVTILAASCIIATFYLREYFNSTKGLEKENSALDQMVANTKAHVSILGDKLEDTEGDLKQSRAAADASFYNMTQGSTGSQATKRMMKDLERSRTYYVGILKEVSLKPDAAAQRGRAMHSLAHIEQKMARNSESVDHYRKAIETFEGSLDRNGVNDDHRQDVILRLADCYESIGMMNNKPASKAALESLSKAVWYLEKVLEADPKDSAAATRLAENSLRLGETLSGQKRFEEAIAAYSNAADRAVALRSQSDSAQKNRYLDKMISKLQFNAAKALQEIDRNDQAVDAYIATIESVEQLRSTLGYSKDETMMMAESFLALGDIFGEIDNIDPEDKDQVYNEALRLVAPLNRELPDNIEYAIMMCHSLSRLSLLELNAGHPKDGYNLSVRGIETLSAALNVHNEDLEGYIELAQARLNHLEFLNSDKKAARIVTVRGVASATSAHDVFIKEARSMSSAVREQTDQRLRRLFSSYSSACSDLGQRETAAKCNDYASFKLSSKD